MSNYNFILTSYNLGLSFKLHHGLGPLHHSVHQVPAHFSGEQAGIIERNIIIVTIYNVELIIMFAVIAGRVVKSFFTTKVENFKLIVSIYRNLWMLTKLSSNNTRVVPRIVNFFHSLFELPHTAVFRTNFSGVKP